MFKIYLFLLSATITCGMNMPGPVNRPPGERHVRWSQSNVFFPGPTNHHFYYSQAPGKVNQYVNRPNVRPGSSEGPSVSPATAERPNSSPSPPTPVTSIDNGYDDEEVCLLDNNPPEPESQCCGVEASSRNFIVGGNVTSIEQYPWLARIEYYNEAQKRFKTLCGGFLISGRYVLTAAHCLVGEILELGKPTNVILGEYNSTHDGPDCTGNRPGARSCSDGAIKVPIQSLTVHDGHKHDKNASFDDIALIKLKDTVQFTNFIRPLCIPNVDITASPPPNLRFFVAGWGAIKQRLVFQSGQKTFAGEYDNVKRDVDLPYRDVEDCRAKLGDFIGDNHICAGGEKGKDSCRGDSGGPLMYERDGVFEAVGIVSAGSGKKPCGTEDYPAIYTKVFKYREWIEWHTRF